MLKFSYDVFHSGTKLDTTSVPAPLPPPWNSPSWEAKSILDGQKISCILQNPKVHYHINNSLPLVCTRSQSNPVHPCPSCFFKANFNIILRSTPKSSKVSLSSDLHNKTLYMYSMFPIHVTCLTHLIFFDLTTQKISGVQYKSWHSSLCNPLQSPGTSALLGSNIFPSTLFLNTLSTFFLNVTDGVSHALQSTHKITVPHTLIFIFLCSKREDGFWTEMQEASEEFNVPLTASCMRLFCLWHCEKF